MTRIMAIDYGDARTGVAISDLLCSITGSTQVIHGRMQEKLLASLAQIVKENDVGELVVGLPRNMDGTEGARAETAHAFGDMLIRLSDGYIKAVHYCDERLSTVEAHGILSFSNVHSKKRKKVIDTLSAELILQYLLDEKRKNKQ